MKDKPRLRISLSTSLIWMSCRTCTAVLEICLVRSCKISRIVGVLILLMRLWRFNCLDENLDPDAVCCMVARLGKRGDCCSSSARSQAPPERE